MSFYYIVGKPILNSSHADIDLKQEQVIESNLFLPSQVKVFLTKKDAERVAADQQSQDTICPVFKVRHNMPAIYTSAEHTLNNGEKIKCRFISRSTMNIIYGSLSHTRKPVILRKTDLEISQEVAALEAWRYSLKDFMPEEKHDKVNAKLNQALEALKDKHKLEQQTLEEQIGQLFQQLDMDKKNLVKEIRIDKTTTPELIAQKELAFRQQEENTLATAEFLRGELLSNQDQEILNLYQVQEASRASLSKEAEQFEHNKALYASQLEEKVAKFKDKLNTRVIWNESHFQQYLFSKTRRIVEGKGKKPNEEQPARHKPGF